MSLSEAPDWIPLSLYGVSSGPSSLPVTWPSLIKDQLPENELKKISFILRQRSPQRRTRSELQHNDYEFSVNLTIFVMAAWYVDYCTVISMCRSILCGLLLFFFFYAMQF